MGSIPIGVATEPPVSRSSARRRRVPGVLPIWGFGEGRWCARATLLARRAAEGEVRGEPRERRVERATQLHEETLPEAGFELDPDVFGAFVAERRPEVKRRPSR
jgi:hypothetical protein